MTYNYIYVGVKHCRDNNKKEKGLPCKMQKMCPIINIVPKIFTWKNLHSVKSVQIRSFFWSVFSRIQTEYRPEKTPYLKNFHAVFYVTILQNE